MPSELPPPPKPDLAEQVWALAERMAKSVGCGVGDVLRRTKSRNWMLGRIRKLASGYTDEQVRQAIAGLSLRHRPTSPEEQEAKRQEAADRRPLEGLEPCNFPIWTKRAERLGVCVVYPMDMEEVLRRSAARLRWARNFTIQTVAAAEDLGEVWYDGRFWQRTAERIIVANSKSKTKRVTRHLPVTLKPEDHAELVQRLRTIDDERDALEAELVEQKKVLGQRIRDRETAREKVVEALKTGRETHLVECEERWSYDLRQVTVVRKDSGEIVEAREMTAQELQLQLPETASAGTSASG